MSKTNILLLSMMMAGCATKQPVTRIAVAPPPEVAPTATIGGYSISPNSASAASGGGNGSIGLTVPTWTATSSDSWLTVNPSSGTGNATLNWSAAPNAGAARTGSLTIADQTFTVTQAGGVVPPATNIWVKRFGSTGTDYGAAAVTDAAGNIFFTGVFSGTVSFGGSPLVSSGSYDTFLCKFTAAGDHVWSVRFGGPAGEVVKSIALDPSGNILVSGVLQSCSIVKFSPTGNVLWIAGPIGADFTAITTDSQGNIFATGSFSATFATPMDFGNGIFLFSQFGATDCFFAKYSPSGTCLFARAFINSGDADYGNGIAVNRANDNVLLAGYGTGRINLGGQDLTNNVYGNTFGFLGKFLPNGNHVWSRRLGVTLTTDTIGSSWARTRSLGLDANGDVILGGEFHLHTQLAGEPVDGTSAQINGTSSYYDLWLAKYSGANGAYQWSYPVRGNQYAGFNSIQSIASGVLSAGFFYGTYNFGPQATLTATGTSPKYNSDGFLLKLTPAGAFTSVEQFGGPLDADIGRSVADSIVATGSFQGTAMIGGQSVTSAGGQDVFLWKLVP